MSKLQSSKIKLDFYGRIFSSVNIIEEYATPTHLFLPPEILSCYFSFHVSCIF